MADIWPAIGLSLRPGRTNEISSKANGVGAFALSDIEKSAASKEMNAGFPGEPSSTDLYKLLYKAALEAREFAEHLINQAEVLLRDMEGGVAVSLEGASITYRMLLLETEAERAAREAIHRLENCRSYLLLQSTKRTVLAPSLRSERQASRALEGVHDMTTPQDEKGVTADPGPVPASRTSTSSQLPNPYGALAGGGPLARATPQQEANSPAESASQILGSRSEPRPASSCTADSDPPPFLSPPTTAEFQFLSKPARPGIPATGSTEREPAHERLQAGSPRTVPSSAKQDGGAEGPSTTDGSPQHFQSMGSSPEGSPHFLFVPRVPSTASNALTPGFIMESRGKGAAGERSAWMGNATSPLEQSRRQGGLSWPGRDSTTLRPLHKEADTALANAALGRSRKADYGAATQDSPPWKQSPVAGQVSGEILKTVEPKGKAASGGLSSADKGSPPPWAKGAASNLQPCHDAPTSSVGLSLPGGLLQQYMQKGRLKLATSGEGEGAAEVELSRSIPAAMTEGPSETREGSTPERSERSPTLGPASNHLREAFPRDPSVNKPEKRGAAEQPPEQAGTNPGAPLRTPKPRWPGGEPGRNADLSSSREARPSHEASQLPSDAEFMEPSEEPAVGLRLLPGAARMGADLAADSDFVEGSDAPLRTPCLLRPPSKRQRLQRKVVLTDAVEDGWNWRKYGQKETMHNSYPRSYYRCKERCGAKKQVERCSENPGKVRITYEGEHSHPKPALRSAAFSASEDCPNSTATPNSMSPISPGMPLVKSPSTTSSASAKVPTSLLRPSAPSPAAGSMLGEEVGDEPPVKLTLTTTLLPSAVTSSGVPKGMPSTAACPSSPSRAPAFAQPPFSASLTAPSASAPAMAADSPTVEILPRTGCRHIPTPHQAEAGGSLFSTAGAFSRRGTSSDNRSQLLAIPSPLFSPLSRTFGDIFRPEARNLTDIPKPKVKGTFGDIYRQTLMAWQTHDMNSPPPNLTLGREGSPSLSLQEQRQAMGETLGADTGKDGCGGGEPGGLTEQQDSGRCEEKGTQDTSGEYRLAGFDCETSGRAGGQDGMMREVEMEVAYGGARDAVREASFAQYEVSAEGGMDLDLGMGVGNSQCSSPGMLSPNSILNRLRSPHGPSLAPEVEGSDQSGRQGFTLLGITRSAQHGTTPEGSQGNADDCDGSSPRIIITRRSYRPSFKAAQVLDDKISPTFVGCLNSPLCSLSPVVTQD